MHHDVTEHIGLCLQTKIILIHMDAHPQLIYLIILKTVFIQNIKFRPTTVIARRIVYTHCISQINLGSKMQY